MPVFLLQFSFCLILLLVCQWHGNMKQFVQGHLGKQCGFFCQPHWSPAPHHKAYIFVGHRRCKAAGWCVGNGQYVLTHVMIMPVDRVEWVGCICMLYCIQAPKAVKRQTACLYHFCYLSRLQNLSFCHLCVIKNMINQVLFISSGVFLKTGWICKDLQTLHKREVFADAKPVVT